MAASHNFAPILHPGIMEVVKMTGASDSLRYFFRLTD